MQELGPAPTPPSQQELIEALESVVSDVMKTESVDDGESDRTWILRKNFNNFLYHRGLQNYAPQLIQSILQYTTALGLDFPDEDQQGTYDFTQKHYTGFLRKFVAIMGNRMPNITAMPNNPADEEGVRSTKSANPAAIYIREKCDLEAQHLEQASRIFDFGTTFWHCDWVVDGDKYGYDEQPNLQPQATPLGNAAFQCPQCGATIPSEPDPQSAPANCPQCGAPLSMDHFQPPASVNMPAEAGPPKRIPKGALEIHLRDSNEVWVPLDSTCIDDCDYLRWEREEPKGRVLRQHPELRESKGTDSNGFDSNASQLGTFFRSAMASPLGLVRVNRANRWTCVDEWWTPNQYELVGSDKDDAKRQMLKDNFPNGARFIFKRGKLVEIRAEKLQDHWTECKPEPMNRIMCDALGDEWTETTDIANNATNQMEQTISRSNMPVMVNANKVDTDAWQNRRTRPAEVFGIIPRAGRALSDEVYAIPAVQFSEQIPIFRKQTIDDAQNNTGLVPEIWGGGEPDPTARQTLLKTNQALMQLGLFWTQIRKCLEKTMLKACKILADYGEGIISFSKKNQFGRFDTMSFTAADLKSDTYHFEADEAIPVNWGQQRDQLMWLLGQAKDNPQLLSMLGVDDPFNVYGIIELLGIPIMRKPQFDEREKCMDVIAKLISDVSPGPNGEPPAQQMQPGPPNPDGSPGDLQPTVQPDWEDNHPFASGLIKAYLLDNADLQHENYPAYQNIQAYGKAQDKLANPPQPPPPPKVTVATSFKGSDVGSPAVQAILNKTGVLPDGVQVAPPPDPKMIEAQTHATVANTQAAQAAMQPPPVPPQQIQ